MRYFIDLFSPTTFSRFISSGKNISGYGKRQEGIAKGIKKGDLFICYLTKISRFCGILEVQDKYFIDSSPIFVDENDPYIIRFKVKPIALLDVEYSIPIFDDLLWKRLIFTQEKVWTSMIRSSLRELDEKDGKHLYEVLFNQTTDARKKYPLTEVEQRKLRYAQHTVKTNQKIINVTVPENEEDDSEVIDTTENENVRESIKIQAEIAKIGESMGMKIWIPKSDRQRVLGYLKGKLENMVDDLPLNYDSTTLTTIENIDVLWLKGRSIIRAFEVEHTTSIYSGILRMADLMALQPNLDIKAHIVAPEDRKEKVFQEINRPVFSLIEGRPLSERCTFISYDSIIDLSKEKKLHYMNDMVLEEYQEYGNV
jgi:predicted RNA-binding protein